MAECTWDKNRLHSSFLVVAQMQLKTLKSFPSSTYKILTLRAEYNAQKVNVSFVC